jgi:L-asparaginase
LQLDDPEQQLEGLIIEAYGAGNLPSGNPADPLKGKVYQILARAKERGIIIVNNTKCLSGMVNSNAYASGSWLSSIEVVSAYDMTSVAIYTKLLYVLALAKRHHWSQPMIRKVLSTNLCSDMVDVHCLDSMGQRSLWPGESLASRDGTARLTNDLFRGPQLVLMDRKTGQWGEHPVWSAIDHPVGLSCVLRMQENGNLTFRDKALHVLWESGTAEADDPYCRLELVGSTEPEGPALFVYNYMTNQVTRKLYPTEANGEGPSHKRRKTVA